jgi:hypothetical protein
MVEIAIVIMILCIFAVAVTFTLRGSNEGDPQSSCVVDARTPTTAAEVSLAPEPTPWHLAPDGTLWV